MKNNGRSCRRGFPVPAPIAIGGGTGGQQAPRQRTLRFSRTLTFSMRREDITNREGRLCPGVAPPDPSVRLPWTCRSGRAEQLSMKNDRWTCRRVLSIPAPIATGGGTGGQQAPRERTLRYSRTLTFSMRREDRTNREGRLCPGVAPPDPRVRLPWTCGDGEERCIRR